MGKKILKVKILPCEIILKAQKGQSLKDVIREKGILFDFPCNGKGLCGKCIVIDEIAKKPVLACHTMIEKDSVYSLPSPDDLNIKLYLKDLSIDVPFIKSACQQISIGAAVDIGTTIVSIAIVDLNSGKIVDTDSFLNPQIPYGADVISRLGYMAEKSMDSPDLGSIIRKKIASEISRLLSSNDYKSDDLNKIQIVGNTPMLYLFWGLDFSTLLIPPYTSVEIEKIIKGSKLLPDEFRILHDQLVLSTLPAIGGFIGSDITSDIIALDFLEGDESKLLIDIGTNGEIVLKTRKSISACSTAAGPAFEGVSLSSGMRAASGAITGVSFVGNELKLTTIDDAKPKGICGSGAIEIVEFLLQNSLIDKNGTFKSDDDLKQVVSYDLFKYLGRSKNERCFTLHSKISITQSDIRAIQLGKSAIRTGIEILMRHHGISSHEIDKCYITGSFGSSLSSISVKALGLIPQDLKNVIFISSCAIKGAILSLLKKEIIQNSKIFEKIEHVPLVSNPHFQELFISNLNFG
jgi:uncharacterized 2Fe-2S/4Fe-4S cluster protein (DUF4445 family)